MKIDISLNSLPIGPSPNSIPEVESIPIILPEGTNTPSETNAEPVNSCLSSEVSPNLVDPDEYIILAETNSVWNSWAVTIPETVRSPVKVPSPLNLESPFTYSLIAELYSPVVLMLNVPLLVPATNLLYYHQILQT